MINAAKVPVTAPLDKSKHRYRFTVSRRKAQAIMEYIKAEFTYETENLVPRIKHELRHCPHDSHIAFEIYEDNMDEFTALQYACMELVFIEMITEGAEHDKNMDIR